MREFVADIGNTRIKWGECSADGLFNADAMPLIDPVNFLNNPLRTYGEWAGMKSSRWTLAGTNPAGRDRLEKVLVGFRHSVRIIDDYRELPIKVLVDFPEKVGIDRLLNAVSVLARLPRGTPAIIVNAGSAVTVDLVDRDGDFRGGAILPGFRLMARSLNDYTAQLPFIEQFSDPDPLLPATNTIAAISAGITHSILGGVERIVRRMTKGVGQARIFLAGGDAELLRDLDCQPEVVGPFLTLEGIRIAARNLS